METEALIEGMRRYFIHGEPYVVVYFSHLDDPETVRQAQLSEDQLPHAPRVGERVWVLYLAGVVAGMRRATAEE